MEADISRANELVRRAERIVFFTGAGISAASGIPDYRGPDGTWTKDPQAERDGHIKHYMRDVNSREREWKRWFGNVIPGHLPNAAHNVISSLRSDKCLAVITQNVDGLHNQAEWDYLDGMAVPGYELHGCDDSVRCQKCGITQIKSTAVNMLISGVDDLRCPECDGVLRRNVVMFGEDLDPEVFAGAQKATDECDLMIVVGSTCSVHPANTFPLCVIHDRKPLIVINQGPTEIDAQASLDLDPNLYARFNGDCNELLPEILKG